MHWTIARIEAGFMQAHVDFMPPISIHLDRSRSPFELDLGRLVEFKKPNFKWPRALLEEQRRGSRYPLRAPEIPATRLRAPLHLDREAQGQGHRTVTQPSVALREDQYRAGFLQYAVGAARVTNCGPTSTTARAASGRVSPFPAR